MRRIHLPERIDDPVDLGGPLSFISRAEDVENLVAAVKAMQRALAGLACLVLQPLQPVERNLFQ